MERVAPTEEAFGKPGIEPRWTRGNKDAVGTAYSASTRVSFTLAAGILNEVHFPATDRFFGRQQSRDHRHRILGHYCPSRRLQDGALAA